MQGAEGLQPVYYGTDTDLSRVQAGDFQAVCFDHSHGNGEQINAQPTTTSYVRKWTNRTR